MTNKTGRPSKLTEEIKKNIFDCLVVDGLTVDKTCDKCGISKTTFYNWFNDDEEFLNFSARLREVKAHKHIQEADSIIDDIIALDASKEDKEVMKFELNKLRAVYDMKLRLAGKYNRQVYGEKLDSDVTSNGKEVKSIAIVPNKQEADKWGKK